MDIEPKVYIGVGSFVIVFSLIVSGLNSEVPLSKFLFFILVASIFILVGIVKLISGPAQRKPMEQPQQLHLQKKQQKQSQQNNQQQENPKYKFCSSCQTISHYNDRFCRMCGHHHFYVK